MVPTDFIEKYKLIDNPRSPSGTSTLVIGMDHPHLLPKDLDVKDGCIVYRSRITGKILLGGRVKDNGNMEITNNRMTINQH